MISKWNYLPFTSEEEQLEQDLMRQFSSRPISEILVRRGVRSVADAKRFLRPAMSDLHDPFIMDDMQKAVDRLNQAFCQQERILVYGDYDVDGTTAVALVYKYLRNFYSKVDYYIPTRIDEGYGISLRSIDEAAEKGVSLIIVLDCGIKEFEPISYAKSLGIDFIVCDHHVPDDHLPEAVAILNPKLPWSKYPCPHLCGCGVGFKFMQAFAISNGLNSHSGLDALLDLVAIATIADIMPMIGENRIFVQYGMHRLNHNPNAGLRALIKLCNLNKKDLNISDVVFKLAPRINAAGRMQSGLEAVKLLVSRTPSEALLHANRIEQFNNERKELDKRITEEANNILSRKEAVFSEQKSLVIYNKDWHRGIIGIVASRLTELYYKPSVVLTLEDGYATGSSRSVQGFDVYTAVASTRDLLENFGGHTYAVGLTMKEENIREFARRFEAYVERHIEPHQLSPVSHIDTYLAFDEIDGKFLDLLRQLAPFGTGNKRPDFCTVDVRDYGTSKLVGKTNEHIKLDLIDPTCQHPVNGIAFNSAKYFDYIHSGKPFKIVYNIENNQRQVNKIQLQVKKIIVPGMD